jgi:hypothetical protein
MGDTTTTAPTAPPAPSPSAGASAGSAAAPAGDGPAPPQKIVAHKGQFFCEFAAEKGFRNCEKWRAANPPLAEKATLEEGDEVTVPEKQEGETADQDKAKVESVRVDYPPALVRFLGQTSTLADRSSAGLTRLGISNYVTDKAGFDDRGNTKEFFKDFGADDEAGRNADPLEAATWNDPDHFRVEVHDVTAGKKNLSEVQVELQVLQPLYKRVDEAGKTVLQRDEENRPDPNAPKGFRIPGNPDRRLLVTCKRVGATNYYRSRYLRLVTETEDKVADHTLFVGDYYQDPLVGATAPASALGSTPGHGPTAGGIAGGAAAGALVGGGAAAAAVMLTENKLSDKEKAAVIGGAALGGAVLGGVIGGAASADKGAPAPPDAGKATAMTPQEVEDTRRYAEILHQKVRARYIPAMCTDQKCRAETLADVGELKNEIRLAVHVFDTTGVTDEDVRRCIYGQCRRVYAQAGIVPHLKAIYHHPAPEHIVLIGSNAGTGRNATGFVSAPPAPGPGPAPAPPAKSRVRVKLDGGHEQLFELSPNEKVTSVVARIKGWIEGLKATPGGERLFWTRVVKRPFVGALPANTEESQYILVFKDADLTQHGKVLAVDSNDFNGMSANNPSVTAAQLASVPKSEDDNVQTILRASCHTRRLDCLVLGAFSSAGLHGLAIRHPKRQKFAPSVLVTAVRMSESPHDTRYTLAHEVGHVVMNVNHCEDANSKEQLMITGGLVSGIVAATMPGRRRIMDRPMQVKYKAYTNDVTVAAVEQLLGSTAALNTAVERCHMFLPGVLDSFGAATPREPKAEW